MSLDDNILNLGKYQIGYKDEIDLYPDIDNKMLYINKKQPECVQVYSLLRQLVMTHPVFRGYTENLNNGKPLEEITDKTIHRIVVETYKKRIDLVEKVTLELRERKTQLK